MDFLSRFGALAREQVPFLIFLHSLLFRASRELSQGLSDEELATVVSTLERTYETLSKGVHYEHKSEDIRLQGIITRLGDFLTRRKEMTGVPPASDADVLAVLACTQSAIAAHASATEGPKINKLKKTYLEVGERVFRGVLAEFPEPEIPPEARPQGLIVEP